MNRDQEIYTHLVSYTEQMRQLDHSIRYRNSDIPYRPLDLDKYPLLKRVETYSNTCLTFMRMINRYPEYTGLVQGLLDSLANYGERELHRLNCIPFDELQGYIQIYRQGKKYDY